MKTVALFPLLFALTLAGLQPVLAQKTDLDLATEEGARRQALKIEMDRKLADAQAAEKKGAFQESANLYSECVDLTKKIGTGVSEPQQKQIMDGFVSTRLQLAEQAQRAGDYGAAEDQYGRILREDPKNERVIQLREANQQVRAAEAGRRPSQEALDRMPD